MIFFLLVALLFTSCAPAATTVAPTAAPKATDVPKATYRSGGPTARGDHAPPRRQRPRMFLRQLPLQPQNVTLRITWYNDGNEGEVMRSLLDRYEKENPGIKVVMDTVAYADLDKTLQPQAEAGTPPDLARVTDLTRYRAFYLDLRPYLKDAAAWEKNWAPQFLQSLRPASDTTGLSGFPTQFTVSGPFINRTLFAQAGVPVPSDTKEKVTWDEWIAAAKKVAEATKTDYAVAIDRSGPPLLGSCAEQLRANSSTR